jgi:hypothetical protein
MAKFVVTKAPLGLAPEVVGRFGAWEEATDFAEAQVPAGWNRARTAGGPKEPHRFTITASNPDAIANLTLVIEARRQRWRER